MVLPRRPDLRRLALAFCLAAASTAAQAAPPSDPQAALEALEHQRQLHESQAAAARASAAATATMQAALTQQRIETAAKLRDAENATAAVAEQLAALAAKKKAVTAGLLARAAAFAPLLPLIERLALFPSETLLAVPAPPRDTLRGLLVLQGLSQEIERQSAELKAQREALDQISAQMEAAAPALAEAEAVQARQGAVLDAQIASAQRASRRHWTPPTSPPRRPHRMRPKPWICGRCWPASPRRARPHWPRRRGPRDSPSGGRGRMRPPPSSARRSWRHRPDPASARPPGSFASRSPGDSRAIGATIPSRVRRPASPSRRRRAHV